MGSTIWVEVEGRPLRETADDCSKMKRLANELDDLAAQLGLQKLGDFFDYSEMARAADAELAALEGGDDDADDDVADDDDDGDDPLGGITCGPREDRGLV